MKKTARRGAACLCGAGAWWYGGGMEIIDIAAGVFIANVVTVAFLWCARELGRHDGTSAPWWALFGFTFPLLMTVLILI